MASSKLTLIGLYNYNNSIFDNMNLPAGIDKDILVDNILLNCGEFEVLYADNEFLKGAIGIWSRKWYRTIEKWINALSIEYDPLSNYDRTETWSDTSKQDSTGQRNDTNSETIANDTTSTHTSTGSATDISSGSGSGESENTVSAFDSNAYVPHDKNTNSTTTSNNSTSNTTANGTDTIDNDVTKNGSNSSTSTENITNTSSHTGRMFGNIGVTTSQQMLQSELDIAKWNLYEHITDIFAKEFCIMIY